MFASVALACALCIAPAACGSGTLVAASVPVNTSTYLEKAGLAIQALQTWYNSASGQYADPAGWWHSANAITTLVDYERTANDTSYLPVIANTFAKAQAGSSGHSNFTNMFYDDTGWWGLAWIDAYDLTGNQEYLSMAETIFTYMTGGWDTATCGGGIWWNTTHTYKNAITNELFLTMAAKLANRTSGSASAGYLTWAQKEWTWFLASGMINASGLINDGLNDSNPAACKNNNGIVWSYNQGVVLGGLVELSHAVSDPTLLARAQSIANAVLSPASGMLTSNGILVDHGVSGGDAPQFKGIFMRNLMALYAASPNAQYKSFADANADSIWANDNNATRFGALWQGPVDSTDATRQSSALDALIAAAAMN
ncbi:MAG TPA: glycoside hydrolase family 76 protein [Acidobacteriaceae bacterium]|nr:glycoside hydrolase family 76 protein [Acidobacteriaceae bacterium]